MKRTVIIGNSGSGKSYLARSLSDRFGYPVIHLDTLFWEPGGFNLKRPKEVVYAEIAGLVQGESWIVEGVFGELAQQFFARADYLIWLDLDREACLNSLARRGSESSKQRDEASAEENFKKLITWASAYWEREGPRSWRGHQALFEQFSAEKLRLSSREAVNDFVALAYPQTMLLSEPVLSRDWDTPEEDEAWADL
jgi:adenylate kinase family enzyme